MTYIYAYALTYMCPIQLLCHDLILSYYDAMTYIYADALTCIYPILLLCCHDLLTSTLCL